MQSITQIYLPSRDKTQCYYFSDEKSKIQQVYEINTTMGGFMLERYAVVACAFYVIFLMMLAAAPRGRIYLYICLEAEDRLSLSFRSTI